VLLHPAEALNGAAANALLKMLEEPPPQTIFLLVSNSLDRLLPTILSRCRKFPLPMPSRVQALEWLKAQGIQDAEAALAEEGGAPLAAQALAQAGARESLDMLLHELAKPSTETALKTAEKLQKTPLPELVVSTQRWLYDVFSVKLSGPVRYYPRYRKELSALATRADTERLLAAIRSANERRAVAQHPLSARLFIEDMLLDYSALFS
jgi:DNA polymerase-3 subunit delta'